MPHKQDNLERQLSHAKQDLDTRTDVLDKQGVDTKQRRRDPVWRELKARCSRLQRRLRSAAAVTTLTEEVKSRKAEPPVKAKKADAKKSSGGGKKQGAKGGKKKKS
ncbi:MAG: hypothetical protein IH899_04930 [Planctomycetes bacterium]|nr:hypothetical protein [Planctomycetota bacterium]